MLVLRDRVTLTVRETVSVPRAVGRVLVTLTLRVRVKLPVRLPLRVRVTLAENVASEGQPGRLASSSSSSSRRAMAEPTRTDCRLRLGRALRVADRR